ncbi:MAG: hypothetical protein AAF388_04755 [Bacteroidota bacterium]
MKDKLSDLYDSLPVHRAPDKIWEQVEEELDHEKKTVPMYEHQTSLGVNSSSRRKKWMVAAAILLLGAVAMTLTLILPPETPEEVSLEKKIPDQKLNEEANVTYQEELILSREEKISLLLSLSEQEDEHIVGLAEEWQGLMEKDSEQADAILGEFSNWLMKHPEMLPTNK